MPISASSNPDRLIVLAGALLVICHGEVASAQSSSEPASLERLRAATASTKSNDGVGPTSLPSPSPELKKRAFEAMRQRVQGRGMEERARSAEATATQDIAAQHEAMTARIYQAIGLAPPGEPQAPPTPVSHPARAFVPLLFASSAMPVETLRTYASSLEKIGGVIAFRGMPGGLTKIGPMAELTARMLRIDPGCEGAACAMRAVQVVVDPILFRQHGVSRVPAFAMVPGDPTQPYCEREDETGPRASHLVYGDAALSGLIEEYARLGGKEEVSDAAARLSRR